MTEPAAPDAVRSSLAVALDVDDAVAALRLARELRPWVGVAKVGLELYSTAGPDVVGSLQDLGYDVFCGLKFHDIPPSVERASRVVGALCACYLNFHAAGGRTMLAAGLERPRSRTAVASLTPRLALPVHPLPTHRAAP